MPYPYFMELISYYNDPDGFIKTKLTDEDIEDTKNRITRGLEKLRSSNKYSE